MKQNLNLKSFITILIFTLILYYPVISHDFLFHDDYGDFGPGSGNGCPWSPLSMLSLNVGRPLNQWELCGYGLFIHRPEDGRIARFLILINVSIMAWLFFVYMTKSGLSSRYSTIISCLILTLPSVAIYTFWTQSANMSLGIILASLAAVIVFNIIEFKFIGKKRLLLGLIASLLLLSSMMSYQPSGMVYWGFLSLSIWYWGKMNDREWVKNIIAMSVFGFFIMATYGLAFMLTSYKTLKYTDHSRSLHSLANISQRFHEFYFTLMPNIYKIWLGNPFSWFPEIIMGVIVIGIILSSLTLLKKILIFLMHPILCAISFSPVLFSNFPETFLRTMFPVWVVVIAYLSFALSEISIYFKKIVIIPEYIYLIFLGLGFVFQYQFLNNILVKPSSYEFSFIKEKLNILLDSNKKLPPLVLCPLEYKSHDLPQTDEYGVPTWNFPQDREHIIIDILRQDFHYDKKQTIETRTIESCHNLNKTNNSRFEISDILKSGLWPKMTPISTPEN